MTIPTRPAPAPPGSRGQNAAAGANASLEQLRRQLQQQQQQQQQNGGTQRMTIKLPPPPKTPNGGVHQPKQRHANSTSHNNINNNNDTSNSSAITRKFPQARYAPATNWDDSPFDTARVTSPKTNGNNYKKVPPPRPPPPNVQAKSAAAAAAARKAPTTANGPTPQGTSNILTNIFLRKKSSTSKATANAHSATRVYGVSSGTTQHQPTTYVQNNSYATSESNNWELDWGSTGSYSATTFATTKTRTAHNYNSNALQEAQLISFDSPPGSPTLTQKSNSDCVSVDSFSSDSNFSSPQNGSVSQPESGFEDDFSASRSRPATTSPLDPWETLDAFNAVDSAYGQTTAIGTAPVRNLNTINTRIQNTNDNPLCNGRNLLPPTPTVAMPTIIKPKISQKPKAPKPPLLAKPLQHTYNGANMLDGNLPTPPSPPMPQCAPPPPPPTIMNGGFTLLDVISGKVDAMQLAAAGDAACAEETSRPYGVALYDFDGIEAGDLSFRENEKIYILEQMNDEWYRGRTRSGCEGIFPVNYIDIKVPLAAPVATANANAALQQAAKQNGFSMQQHAVQHSKGHNASYSLPRVRCLYHFPAEVAGDLELQENDFVTILYRINEDWLHGEINGKQGQFPANFLEYIPDNIPMP